MKRVHVLRGLEARIISGLAKRLRTAIIITCSLLAVAIMSLLYSYFSHVTSVQRKASPDRKHNAKLVRYDGIDVNFDVVVDGANVFRSADFAPVVYDCREQINWDASGDIVILEIAGQELFGYDAAQQRNPSAEEILNTTYPPFSDYAYEGSFPGEPGRQRQKVSILFDTRATTLIFTGMV
jgi:hypothetical protein